MTWMNRSFPSGIQQPRDGAISLQTYTKIWCKVRKLQEFRSDWAASSACKVWQLWQKKQSGSKDWMCKCVAINFDSLSLHKIFDASGAERSSHQGVELIFIKQYFAQQLEGTFCNLLDKSCGLSLVQLEQVSWTLPLFAPTILGPVSPARSESKYVSCHWTGWTCTGCWWWQEAPWLWSKLSVVGASDKIYQALIYTKVHVCA